jgi:hypothetical protein
VDARQAHISRKAAAKAEAKAALAGKRAADVAMFGNNSSQEREVALALVAAWRESTGLPSLVLNDGTRADVLLGHAGEDDTWLAVQLKTTGHAKKGQPNMWMFAHVNKYAGMPVVCWRCDHDDGWVYDGDVLVDNGKCYLGVTPGGKNDVLAEARGLSMSQLVEWLRAHLHRWPVVTEEDARHDFESEAHRTEMRGIDAFRARFPEHVYEWPGGQNTHVDLVKDATIRQQFKTACTDRGRAGFCCTLFTRSGKDEAGKQLVEPYPADAFDELVAVAWVDGAAHFWVIPMEKLVEHGAVRTATAGDGITRLVLYGPIGKQPDPKAYCKADTWTSEFYVNAHREPTPTPTPTPTPPPA